MRELTLRLCREAMARVDVNAVLPFCAVFVPFMVDPHEIEDEIGIPVINGVAVGLRTAEMFVDLKMVHSKKAYPATPARCGSDDPAGEVCYIVAADTTRNSARIAALARGTSLDFRQLRYALSVSKERSFTRAAKRLNISQSAVSEQVRLLEEEVGFDLFTRTSRGIEATDRGRTFLYESERVVGDLLSLSDTARRLRGAVLDTLTIAMGSGMAQIFMPRLFADLKGELPGVRLEIITAPTRNIFTELHEERIDAGLAIESDPDRLPSGLVVDRLVDAEMALIVPAKHPLGRGKQPVDIGRLLAEPLIMSELTVGYGQVVMSLFTDLGMRPNVIAVVDNIETIKIIVQSGGGIAIVPRACVTNEVALGLLKAMPIAPARNVAFSLFRRRQPMSRRKETALQKMLEMLKG